VKKPLSRRAVLAGLGTFVALPMLEAMTRSTPRARADQQKPPLRFVTFHFPIGVNRDGWRPSGSENDWQFGQTQADPLGPHKDDLCMITGVDNNGDPSATGAHTCNMATFLTARDVPPGIRGMGTSADQLIADKLAGQTPFRSVELGTAILDENPNDEPGYDPVLKDHLSWLNDTPLPKEVNPAALFDRLFAGGTPMQADQMAMVRRISNASVLDAVRADTQALSARLGKNDNTKLDQYLTGVRELEKRIQVTSSAAASGMPASMCTPGARPGPPADIQEHVNQMLDLIALAFTCDLTRVATFSYETTVTERDHAFLGVNDSYHIGVTHNNPGDPYITVNRWLCSRLGYLLDKLKGMQDFDGSSVLDNSIVYFASELGEGSTHSGADIPMIVAGGAGGRIKPGRLLARGGQGNGNVLLSIMQAFGVTPRTFGNGFTTPLPGLVST
jgi:hypothetical protein